VERFALLVRAAIPETQSRIVVLVQAGIVLGVLKFVHGCPDEPDPAGSRCSTIHVLLGYLAASTIALCALVGTQWL
jgi:hypothetical protein